MVLPAGWEQKVSSSRGIPYYYNKQTGESRWEPPTSTKGEDNTEDTSNTNKKVHAYHLLVKHFKSRRPSSWREAAITRTADEALEILKTYKDQINSSAEPFEKFKELASEYSDCSSAKSNGDLGEFGKGQMQAAFEEATFNLQPNQMSAPVLTDSGWHLIYRVK